MGASAPRGYRGPPLPVPITDLLKALRRHDFQCTATGGGKTIAVSRSGRRCGYVKPYVIRSEGSLGYYLGPLGIEGQQCPARQVSHVVKQFCKRYACSQSDLIVHPLGGTNSGTSLLIIRSPELALRVLLQDAGNAAYECCVGGQTSLSDPVGPHNDEALRELSRLARWTIAAWGRQGRCGRQRAAHVCTLLHRPQCLGVTITGDPRHPLYVPDATTLESWCGRPTARTRSPG